MIAASLVLLLQAASAPDPLEPAWRGQVQCYAPNVARKTCASIGAYARDASGAIQNRAIVLLSAQPQIAMTTTAPVQIKPGGAVCGVIRRRDIATATFEVRGQPASAETAESIRKAIAPAYAPLIDREVCTAYAPDGDALKAQVTIEGKRRPDMDQPVRWVPADAGFTATP